MQKYGLLSVIRRKKYRNNRDFSAERPNQKWVTDISYIHTNQGVLYLSVIRDLYDNALAEKFFSIFKTKCIYRVKLQTYEEARLLIGEYIHFYNHQRIQLKTKLTPLEKRCQYVA